jgi:hypothetical protein
LAALVREVDRSLADLGSQLQQEELGSPAKALTEQALLACSEQEKQILAVLAISRGASLGKKHVSALTGIEDIDLPIESLKRRKLAQSHSPRYSLTGSLGMTLEEDWDLAPANEQALEYFAAWAEQHRQNPQLVAEETEAIVEILRWALREERWEGALRLGRAVEGALAVGGQWGAWTQVLSWQLQAARELGDRAAEAWSLHQAGTQALCLENSSTARTNLSEALRIRESLGDWAGAAVTRHNLDLFLGGPDGTSGPQSNGSGGGGGGWLLPRLPLWQWIIICVATLGILGLSSSAILGVPLPLGSDNFLKPAVQLLNPDVQPAPNSDSLSGPPSSSLDPKSGNSSDTASGSGSGGSGTQSDDPTSPGGSGPKSSDGSDSGDSGTKSGDDGTSPGGSGPKSSDGSDSGDSDRKSPSEKMPPSESKTPAPESKTPAPESKTPAPEPKTLAPEPKTLAPESKTPAPESKTLAPGPKTPAPETKTPAPETTTPAPETTTPAPETTTPYPAPDETPYPAPDETPYPGGSVEH